MAIVTGTKAPEVYGGIRNMMHESKALVPEMLVALNISVESMMTPETRADSHSGTEQPDPLSEGKVCVMPIEQYFDCSLLSLCFLLLLNFYPLQLHNALAEDLASRRDQARRGSVCS